VVEPHCEHWYDDEEDEVDPNQKFDPDKPEDMSRFRRERLADEMPEDIFEEYDMEDYLDDLDEYDDEYDDEDDEFFDDLYYDDDEEDELGPPRL